MNPPGLPPLASSARATWPAAAVAVGAVVLGASVGAWIALAGLVVLAAGRDRLAWWPAGCVLVLAALANSLKWPESDLADYYRYLDEAARSGWWELLADEQAFLSIRITEPLFRALMWLLANAAPAPRVVFAWVGTACAYGCAWWLCSRATRCAIEPGPARPAAAAATAVALLAALTFSLTGHLVRQYMAGGLFVVGVVGFAFDGRRRWLLACVAACLVHNAALLLAAPLTLALLLRHHPRVLALGLAATVAASLAGAIPLLGELAEATSFLKDDGAIGLGLPLLDLTLLAVAVAVWRRLPPEARPPAPAAALLLAFGLSAAVALFCLRDIPLLFFRSYFFLEFLRAPLLAFVVAAGLRGLKGAAPAGAVVAIALAALACWLRVRGVDWAYGHPAAPRPEWLDLWGTLRRWAEIESARL